jgi:hypothetical protein
MVGSLKTGKRPSFCANISNHIALVAMIAAVTRIENRSLAQRMFGSSDDLYLYLLIGHHGKAAAVDET